MSARDIANAARASSRIQVTPDVIVAIPVRNERDRISACLEALASQVGIGPAGFGILLLLNNCTDDTAEVVRRLDMPWPLRVVERNDPQASAGWARRIAMDAADAWLREGGVDDGVLLTSDGDSCVGIDWVARNLAAIAQGADLVAGRITLDPIDAALLPERLHRRGRLESEYEMLLMEIEAWIDPEPGNPWPSHWAKSGATLAVRQAVYRHVGGMPAIPTGEDRAFVDAVRAHDFIVRHAPDIAVVTSGRLDGRALGGVADTIKLRCVVPESPCDDRLERVHQLITRSMWRRRLRHLHAEDRLGDTWRWAPYLSIRRPVAREIAVLACFGAAHKAVEAASPRLAYQPIRPKDLPRQISRAAFVVRAMRAFDRLKSAKPKPRIIPTNGRLPSLP